MGSDELALILVYSHGRLFFLAADCQNDALETPRIGVHSDCVSQVEDGCVQQNFLAVASRRVA